MQKDKQGRDQWSQDTGNAPSKASLEALLGFKVPKGGGVLADPKKDTQNPPQEDPQNTAEYEAMEMEAFEIEEQERLATITSPTKFNQTAEDFEKEIRARFIERELVLTEERLSELIEEALEIQRIEKENSPLDKGYLTVREIRLNQLAEAPDWVIVGIKSGLATGVDEFRTAEGFLESAVPVGMLSPEYVTTDKEGKKISLINLLWKDNIKLIKTNIYIYIDGYWKLQNNKDLERVMYNYLHSFSHLIGLGRYLTVTKLKSSVIVLNLTLVPEETKENDSYLFFQDENFVYNLEKNIIHSLVNLNSPDINIAEETLRLAVSRRAYLNLSRQPYRLFNLDPNDTTLDVITALQKIQEESFRKTVLFNFLHSVFNKDNDYIAPEETIARLQEWGGYALTEETIYQKCLVLQGEGANGKSIFLNALSNMLEDTCSHINIKELFGGSRFALAGLQGKTCNISEDINLKKIDTSIFKDVVGGGTIQADVKFQEPITFQSTAKFIFATNRFEQSADISEGYFRRFDIVQFNKIFSEDERDYSLAKKLAKEKIIMFAWCFQGLIRLKQQGKFTVSEDFSRHTKNFREAQDTISEFITEKLEKNVGEYLTRESLREAYVTWSTKKGYIALTARLLGKELKVRGIKSGKKNINKKTVYIYKGIKLI